MSQRFEGRNLEEALAAASTALGVERFELRYHVLTEKRGFLGGVKRLVIEAEVNDEAIVAAPAAAVPAPATRTQAQPEPPAQRSREGGRQGRGRGTAGRGGNRPRGGERDRAPGRDRGRVVREAPDDFDDSPAPEQGEESPAALRIHEWVDQLIERAGFRLDVRTVETESEIRVRLYGRDARRLTEQHGELLDAIQVLTNKALVGRTVEKPVEFDAGAFKGRREEEIGETARSAAERVRREGREHLLPAMSPVERRIVHLALQDDPAVTTESRGEGFYKRVAIILRPSAAPAPSES